MLVFLHIFKKDFRRLWPLLCVLTAFTSLLAILLMRDLLAGNPPQIEPASYLQSSGLLGPEGIEILVILITVILIHEDPLRGTSAFWLTRPISWKSLVAAKAAFMFLFLVVVPVAADFVVLFHYGLQPDKVTSTLSQVLLLHIAFLSLNAALASLTLSLQGFALAWGVALLTMRLCAQFLRIDVPLAMPAWVAHILIPETLTALVGITVVVHQYMTRRTRRSVIILIVGTLLAIPDAHWAEIAAAQPAFRGAAASADKIELVVRTMPNSGLEYHGPSDSTRRPLFGAFDLTNIPSGNVACLESISGGLHLGSGKILGASLHPSQCYGNALPALFPGYEGTLVPQPTGLIDLLEVTDDDYRQWGDRSGSYSGQAQFVLYQYVPRGEIALKASGERLSIGSSLVTLSRVESAAGKLSVVVVGRSIGEDNLSYYIVNRKSRQILGSGSGAASATLRQLILPGVGISYWKQTLETGTRLGTVFQAVDPDFVADATVLLVERVPVGRFLRRVQISGFRMSDNTLEQWQQKLR